MFRFYIRARRLTKRICDSLANNPDQWSNGLNYVLHSSGLRVHTDIRKLRFLDDVYLRFRKLDVFVPLFMRLRIRRAVRKFALTQAHEIFTPNYW